MSESAPRQQVQYGVPVNHETGQPLTPGQMSRLDKITAAGKVLADIMHEAEGSDPGNDGFSSRRMSIAGTHLETCLMFARKAALEAK